MKTFKIIILLCAFFGGLPLVSMEAPPGKKARTPAVVNQEAIKQFMNAALYGDLGLVNRSLAAGMPVDTRYGENWTALYAATSTNQQHIVARLLEAKASINEHHGNLNNTALTLAAEYGYTELVRLLLKAGADKNALTGAGQTALVLAQQRGHRDIVTILQGNDASPAAQPPAAPLLRNNLGTSGTHASQSEVPAAVFFRTHQAPASTEAPASEKAKIDNAFFTAAMNGDLATINRFLDNGTPPDSRNFLNMTSLFYAAQRGHKHIVERLLKAGALINGDNDSWTPLHAAAYKGHTELVRLLLQKGAHKNACTKNDQTALSLAKANGHQAIVNILSGSDSNSAHPRPQAPLQSNRGTQSIDETPQSTPADIPPDAILASALKNVLLSATLKDLLTENDFLRAVKAGHSEAVLTALTAGADLNVRLADGSSVLHYAATEGKTNLVEILLALGIDVNIKDSFSRTPLHCAVIMHHAAIVRILLTAGANSNAEDNQGSISLHYYVKAKIFDPQLGEILLKAGAKINAQNKYGATPLHWACDIGSIEFVRFLLQHDADSTIATTEFGFTPLHCAVRQGHLDIVASLLRAKAPKDAKAKDGSTAFELAQKNGHAAIALLLKLAGAKVADKIQQVPPTPETDTEAHLPSPRINQDQAQRSVEQAQRAQPGVQLPQGPHSSRKRTLLDDGK